MVEKRVHIIVSGKVHGVFFRANTETKAQELGLKGRVKNLPDGTVDIVAEGPEEKLKTLISWCQKGPPYAVVENIITSWGAPTHEFKSFHIINY